MRYITNGQFVENFLIGSDIDEVLRGLDVVRSLLKKYGRSILSTNIRSSISNTDKSILDYIDGLMLYGKLNLKDISNIMSILKSKSSKYRKVFDISGVNSLQSKEIVDHLSKDFGNIDVSLGDDKEIGVVVSGDGNYFKRTLDADLDKLLR